MKYLVCTFLWILLLSGTALTAQPANSNEALPPRERYNFNRGWLVQAGDPVDAKLPGFDDSSWKPVTLPYAWNEDSAFKVSIHDLPTGIAWYRKHFRVPANSSGRRIFLEFEGIRMAGEVYLNGRFLGRHEDGVAAFGFDITDSALPAPQENVLAVRTDNDWKYKEVSTGTTFHWNDTNFYANYGGINKNVWLHVTAPLHQTLPLFSSLGTTGIYIWASRFDLPHHAATITAESQVRNDSATPQTTSYAVRINDMEHKAIATFSGPTVTLAPGETRTLTASAPVKDLHFWSWGYGYLYDVVTSLSVHGHAIDSVETRTGFRETSFEHGMVRLNGRVIDLHGYGQRTTNEWPALGIDLPPWVSDFSNRLMVEGNGNLVRWMHVTPSKQDTESADRVGLMVSMPAGDAEGDSQGRQWEQRVQLMRDSIIYNRNDPSILFYESGNHGISDAHMAEMKAVRDQCDPHGGRAIGAREMLASKIAEYGGEMLYVDKSAIKPLWAHEYNRDEGARTFWDEDSQPFHKDAPLYNRNQDSAALEDIVSWDDYYRARPGTGDRVSAGGVNIIFSDSNTHYRGDNNYRRSGEVDAMRIPKDGYFAHQVMWNGWLEPEKPAIAILGHWNYAAGTVKPVYVVAAQAARVELKLNGKTLGSIQATAFNSNQSLALPAGMKPAPIVNRNPDIPAGQSNDFLFTFPDVAFAPGTLKAIAYDAGGKPLAAARLHTAGPPVAIRLTPHLGPGGLHADGSDLALVDVEIVDANGRRCPTADPMVSFDLTGPAEWRGGIAQGSSKPAPPSPADLRPPNPTPFIHYDNYILATTLPVENGINRISIRSKPLNGSQSGIITLTAKSSGLKPATITLHSLPVPEHYGLAVYDPAAGLPSYVGRGPTPAGDSLRPVRTSVAIASATAGANADKAGLSYDDNESTSWSNNGRLSTAWIEYTLAEPAALTQLDLKLNAFRTRRYPLHITLDGATIYEGTTPNSLGYVTVLLKRTDGKTMTGTHLRIALTGDPVEGSQAAGTAELTGQVDAGGVASASSDGNAILNIVEADIYRSAISRPSDKVR
jgi:beta-galactosidase